MKILIVEPFFTGSHKQWACGFQQHSQHDVEILSLPGRHWKWRMYGGAVALAEEFKKQTFQPDLILASDMLDLATFVALCKNRISNIPLVVYFHENQITYPWSPTDKDIDLKRNNQYGFINYTSALVANHVFFNSDYHLDSFIESLPGFLKQFPDHRSLETIDQIREKSNVLFLGMDLGSFDKYKKKEENELPILLWNHRWEYDKRPDAFYKGLQFLKKEGLDFQLILLGERYKNSPKVFSEIEIHFQKELIHVGYAEGFEAYAKWLWMADILPVTGVQDFFGGSVVEAIYCNALPLLPKRLAYPEHIPAEWHNIVFYNSEDEFRQKLKNLVLEFSQSKNQALSDFVGRYDWSILAPVYDEQFLRVKNEYAN